jgi:hypothetical protein
LTSISRGAGRLAAREREQVRRQVGATGGSLGDQCRNGREVRPVRDSLRQDFDRSGNDGEDVVEVMDDAAGELTDDLHPLSLSGSRLRGFCRQRLLKHILDTPAPPCLRL